MVRFKELGFNNFKEGASDGEEDEGDREVETGPEGFASR